MKRKSHVKSIKTALETYGEWNILVLLLSFVDSFMVLQRQSSLCENMQTLRTLMGIFLVNIEC